MASVRPLQIETRQQGEQAQLLLSGELDIATVGLFEQAVEAVLGAGLSELTIDMRALEFLDSSGLRQFIVLNDRARAEGWALALIRPPQPALSVFQITRAEENLPFVDGPAPG
jgi:anti-sigma B factor antagonist